MNLMKCAIFLFLISFGFCNCKESNTSPAVSLQKSKPLIALQPFEQTDTVLLKTLRNNLSDSLNCELIILNAVMLPENAWYANRKRYIAALFGSELYYERRGRKNEFG